MIPGAYKNQAGRVYFIDRDTIVGFHTWAKEAGQVLAYGVPPILRVTHTTEYIAQEYLDEFARKKNLTPCCRECSGESCDC